MGKPFITTVFSKSPFGHWAHRPATTAMAIVRQGLWLILFFLGVASPAQAFHTALLTVTTVGDGRVDSSPRGIACYSVNNYYYSDEGCTEIYPSGTLVTLSAIPSRGGNDVFAGWGGACTGTGSCSVTMDAAKNVTATFSQIVPPLLTVTTAGTGYGSVSSSPSGINCYVPLPGVYYVIGPDCTQNYSFNQWVTLTATATPNTGSVFAGWGGACTGTVSCSVYMDAAKNVTASFSQTVTVPPPTCTLSASPTSISPGGTSVLTATCNPAATSYAWTGGACSGAAAESPDCAASTFATATTSPSVTTTYTVTGRNAAGTGNTASATVTVMASTARLTVATAGTGYGSVASSPAGISCYVPEPNVAYLVGPDCGESYASGTTVTLTATPTGNSSFTGWSGACTGTGTCRVTMDAARNVTATFAPKPFAAAVSGVSAGLIGSEVATVTTTIAFNAPDVGQPGSVFVVAWVPQGGLGTLGISTPPTTDPNAFVLVQLTSTGWQLVVNSQLIPYATGVLGDQLAAQTILNNTATTSLVGAQFCLGYGTSAAEMTDAGRIQLIARIPDSGTVTAATGSCLLTRPQTGWWWNPLESGRGFSIEVSGNNLAMATFLYDASGRSTWFLSAGPLNPDGSYSGPLSEFTGGQTLTGSYVAPAVKGNVSDVDLSCLTSTRCTLDWVGGTVPIERFVWDEGGKPTSAPETGWWWNAEESGRGYFLEMQGNTLGATAYMYDAAGNALWYLLSASANGSTVQSQWSQFANGQSLAGSYVEPIIANDNVGPVTIQFSSPISATLTLPDGRQIPIERFRF